jgi:hypothetical protein
MERHVWKDMYGKTCMERHVWKDMYGKTCMERHKESANQRYQIFICFSI